MFGLHNYCGCVVQVCDTHELSTSLRTSLDKVISWKFVSRSRCYSTKVRRVGPGVRVFYLPVLCLYILNIKLWPNNTIISPGGWMSWEWKGHQIRNLKSGSVFVLLEALELFFIHNETGFVLVVLYLCCCFIFNFKSRAFCCIHRCKCLIDIMSVLSYSVMHLNI